MKHRQPLVIVGHCGARGLAPGNTLPSFEKALEFQVDAIETDLCATRDNVIVLLHTDVVRLEELINLTNRRTQLMLEVKEPRAILPTIEIIQSCLSNGWRHNEFAFASFDFATLRAVHKAFPQVDIIVSKREAILHALWRAHRLHTRYLCFNIQDLRPSLVRVLSLTYRLYAYTPQLSKQPIRHEPPEKLIQARLYGVITDFPNYFK